MTGGRAFRNSTAIQTKDKPCMSRKKTSTVSLNERAQHLLKVLVEQYITDGQPVGSKALAQASNIDVSSATIRNVMASLEDMGFVHSPHTSAGRVPTVQGYRFFVDSLLTVRSLEQARRLREFEIDLDRDQDSQKLITSVSEFLSGVTRLAGVVTVPHHQRMALKQLEFLPLSDNRVLAILVTNEQEVQNRIIQLHRGFEREELQRIANFLNARFIGKDISRVREELLQEIKRDREHLDQMMQTAVEMAEQLFAVDREEQTDYVLAGQVNLMQFQELSDIDKLRQLFEAFNQKREIIHLLDRCMHAEGVKIFIGEESGYSVLGDCSVVSSSYSVDGDAVGVLGVIGPTRMRYDKVISIVDMTAKVLGSALNSK